MSTAPTPLTSAPGRRHPSAWALWPTVATSWIALAQILSFQGLVVWVVGGSLISALVVLPLAVARRRLLALLAMAGMTVLIPALAEWLGGSTAGPVTRASLMACSAVAAMAVILPTGFPLAILAPSLLLLGGVLGLGTTGSASWLVGLWAVAGAVTVAMTGPYRQPDLRDRRRLVPFALALGGVGLVAITAVVVSTPLLRDPWTIPGNGVVAVPESVPPPPEASDGEASASDPPLPAQATDVPAPQANDALSWLALGLLILLLALLLALLVLVLWRGWVWWQWRRLRRSLSTGTPEQRAVGAWTWLRLRRARCDRPLPISVSPDVAVSWARSADEPDVLAVASITAPAVYDQVASVAPQSVDRAWAAARAGGRTPAGSLRARWRWSAVTPDAARRRVDTIGRIRAGSEG